MCFCSHPVAKRKNISASSSMNPESTPISRAGTRNLQGWRFFRYITTEHSPGLVAATTCFHHCCLDSVSHRFTSITNGSTNKSCPPLLVCSKLRSGHWLSPSHLCNHLAASNSPLAPLALIFNCRHLNSIYHSPILAG